MSKIHSAITILFTLTLTACVTGSDPSNSQNSLTSHSTNQCPTAATMKVDGKPVTVTAPNPFDGLPNPGMETLQGRFSLGLLTKEVGLFELLDFDAANLKAGTFTGDQFRLTLANSPYSSNACTHAKYKSDSKLVIEKYNAETDRKVEGCVYGKLDCDGKLVEINVPISSTIP
ncbi:secreted protein [Beggiatoa sp. PS]|nr:secreted protein [Beggiatoa sp. PS]